MRYYLAFDWRTHPICVPEWGEYPRCDPVFYYVFDKMPERLGCHCGKCRTPGWGIKDDPNHKKVAFRISRTKMFDLLSRYNRIEFLREVEPNDLLLVDTPGELDFSKMRLAAVIDGRSDKLVPRVLKLSRIA